MNIIFLKKSNILEENEAYIYSGRILPGKLYPFLKYGRLERASKRSGVDDTKNGAERICAI